MTVKKMDTVDMEKMNGDAIAKACLYFSQNKKGTAKDADTYGATMCSLCRRGFLKIIGTTTEMVKIGDNLYKEYPANIYALSDKCSAEEMWNLYREHMIKYYELEMYRTRLEIERLKSELEGLEKLRAQFE